MKKCMKVTTAAGFLAAGGLAAALSGCGAAEDDGKVTIEIVQYKQEAASYFETVEENSIPPTTISSWLSILLTTP